MYLYPSKKLGINADLITLARKINNNVSNFIVFKTLEFLELYNKKVEGSKILILGYRCMFLYSKCLHYPNKYRFLF